MLGLSNLELTQQLQREEHTNNKQFSLDHCGPITAGERSHVWTPSQAALAEAKARVRQCPPVALPRTQLSCLFLQGYGYFAGSPSTTP